MFTDTLKDSIIIFDKRKFNDFCKLKERTQD